MDDVAALQAIIDRSVAAAGPSMRRNFEPPEHGLTTRQLLRYWGSGHQQVALATVTATGAPRVAPVGAILRGPAFYVPSSSDAARVAHVRSRPAVSFTHWISLRIAVVVHGTARVVAPDSDEFGDIDATYFGGEWWDRLRAERTGLYLRVDPDRIFAWAADLTTFPE